MEYAQDIAQNIAQTILDGFSKHFRIFNEITAQAQQRFEQADWKAERLASIQRIKLYDKRVDETVARLKSNYALYPMNERVWIEVKSHFIIKLQQYQQPELAETFFNSVFCRAYTRELYTSRFIFVKNAVSTDYIQSDIPPYKAYYPAKTGFFSSITQLLTHFNLEIPFEDLNRDKRYIAAAICKVFKKGQRTAELNFQYNVINALFYRNKAAYIVGKAINGHDVYPFSIPLLNNEKGQIYTDALLIGEDSVSQLFGFSYAYFMVKHPVPSAIVSFLKTLMPRRKREGLYSAIGYQKHGKTDFYRGFLHHLEHSDDNLILAPGIPGMVMSVFTLPSYPYVFKVIRDYFAPPKDISRKQVAEKYQLVKQHDRVGRMADMLEYSSVVLPLYRFSDKILEDLKNTCQSSISFISNDEGIEQLVLDHVYIERRMVPLNISLQEAEDKGDMQTMEFLVKSFGDAIKELSAANIFPGDLLYKNFGVTRLERVVFYDYDEIVYLTDCHFRKIPKPKNNQELMSSEPWYSVEKNDIFPEEFARFLLGNPLVKQFFMKYHADLLDTEFWISKQQNINNGIFEDVFPYPQKFRMKR